jgi:hypothetical protein
LAAAQVGRLKISGVIGVMHHAVRGWLARGAMGVALLFCMTLLAGCTPSQTGPPGAGESFRKEVQAARDSLAPALMDAVADREPRSARTILDKQCALAKEASNPFACGITVLDHHGITLASATPGEPIKRLDYSRYEVVMKALKERKIVKAKLYLQDRTTLYVVGIPLVRQREALGLLVLAFDASDLRDRFGLTEEEFLRVDLNG